MIIGLSGKYCAGKNAAADIFTEMGVPSIDVDKLGHLALDAEIGRIEKEFGSLVIIEDELQNGNSQRRTVNRKALGEIVFSDPERMKVLEAITHPWMVSETTRLADQYLRQGSTHVVVNAAILLKMGLHKICDVVVWIDAPLAVRVKRGLLRDPLKLPAVLKRIHAQRTLKPQPLGKYVDIYKVDNRLGIDQLKEKISNVLNQIEQKGSNGR